MNSVDKVNKLSKYHFISIFGNVFEKTKWIAEETYELKPFNDLKELFNKMLEVFEKSNKTKHLKILNTHPNLAIEKKLTHDSKKEQDNSNLNQCSDEEFEEFKKLNKEYKEKFGFPFIIAVKGKNKKEILDKFKIRISNNVDIEFNEAKKQVKKIAIFRLNEILQKN